MTADAADLIDPGGWKLLMLAPENVKVKMLCPAKIKKNVVEMDAGLAHLIDAHDATKPNQLMKMDRFMTEVRRVKNCHDRAVTDVNFFSLITDDITVQYDLVKMTRTISFSVRKGLSVLNDDVVEADLKMDLLKSRKNLLIHINNIHKSSKGHLINNKMVVTIKNLDEITLCKVEGMVKIQKFKSRKEVDKSSYQSYVDIQIMCENEEDIRLLMLLKSSLMMLQLMMRKLKHVLTHLMCSSTNDAFEKEALYKFNDAGTICEKIQKAALKFLPVRGRPPSLLGLIPLAIKDAKPLVLASRGTFIASTSRSSALLSLFNATQFRVPKRDVMPTEVRAEVDVAGEIQEETLKFPTGKKRLEVETRGVSRIQRCLELH